MATVHLYRAVIKQLTDQWLIWSCSQVSELITVMNDLQPLTVDSVQWSIRYYRAVRGAVLQWFDLNHLQLPALTFK